MYTCLSLKLGKELQTDKVFKTFLFLDNWISYSNYFTKTKERGLEDNLHLCMWKGDSLLYNSLFLFFVVVVFTLLFVCLTA